MSEPFRILLVPHVVFRELLKFMDFVDIINLSRCSQNSQCHVRNNLFRLKDWKISVACNEGVFLWNKNEGDVCIHDVSKFNNQIIPTHNDGLISHPKTESDRELKKATEYVMHLFKSNMNLIAFGNGGAWLLNWVNERGTKISRVSFREYYGIVQDPDVLSYVLRESRAEIVSITGITRWDFKYTGPCGDFDFFFQINPYWMTIECLISMKCSRIITPFTELTSAHFNRFLKHFVNGGSPQLEFMKIGIGNINEGEILMGLEEYIRRTDNKREYKWKGSVHIYIEETYTFNGLEIVSKNGVCASLDIQNNDGFWTVSVFKMAVWPRP